MAKKKEQELTFGQMPYPQASDSYRMQKVSWTSLNKRQTANTGSISHEINISTAEAPYLTPSEARRDILALKLEEWTDGDKGYTNPLAMFSYNDMLLVVYRIDTKILVDYLILTKFNDGDPDNKYNGNIDKRYTCIAKEYDSVTEAKAMDKEIRSMVLFRVYDTITDVLSGGFINKLLLFPEKVSMPADLITVTSKSEMTDTKILYCIIENSKTQYYTYDGETTKNVTRKTSVDDDWSTDSANRVQVFEANELGVTVNQYYNDGYTPAEGEYNDGYTPSEYDYYNDGYEAVSEMSGSEYAETYYKRVGSELPYTYSPITIAPGSTVTGLFRPVNGGYPYNGDKVFYSRSGRGTSTSPYVYTAVKSLDYGDDVSKYYTLTDKSAVGTIYYKRMSYDNQTAMYTYKQMDGLDHGDDVSKYYIKPTPTTPINDDTEVIDVGGVSFAVNDKCFYPLPGSDKSAYYFNTYNKMAYKYTNTGWVISIPPTFPDLKYVTVQKARLCGVDGNKVYVSGYNDYANWTLDTIDESLEKNAWVSVSQANTEINSDFTGITTYGDHVVCFKKDYRQEIYNSQNPFRLVDIGKIGCVDNRSIKTVNNLLIFASDNDINVYTGSVPKTLGYYLNIENIVKAVSGGDDRFYYTYIKDPYGYDNFYVYDTEVNAWSEQSIDNEVISFANNTLGIFMLDKTGHIYKLNTKDYDIDWEFDTDFSTVLSSSSSSSYSSVDIKHIRKMQFMAYLDKKSYFKVYALYDNEEFDEKTSHLLFDTKGRYGLLPIRFKPRQTANYGYKIHIVGHGYVRLYNMEIQITPGGELFIEGSGFLSAGD